MKIREMFHCYSLFWGYSARRKNDYKGSLEIEKRGSKRSLLPAENSPSLPTQTRIQVMKQWERERERERENTHK